MRASKQLYPNQEPVKTRAAATILLLREATKEGGDQYEVLMTRRSDKASFAPGAYVFPGGVVDAADQQSDEVKTFALAAIRESFEELGVLLVKDADGKFATQETLDKLARHPADSFNAELQRFGLTPAVDDVKWLCHWITDRDLPRRFDARFYVARMPQGQIPVADESEQFEPTWISPTRALERFKAGTLKMIFPTIRTLERMAAYSSVDEVMAACQSNTPLFVSCPRAGLLKGEDARYMEHDLPFGELEMVCPSGQISHNLDWQHLEPRKLTTNVARLTAPNPSLMTGPGTNTYIVGEPGAYAVIDPGPLDQAHLARIAAFVGTDLKHILCTHSHPDHSPGATTLKKITGNTAVISGLASLPTARAHSEFTPEVQLLGGERFKLGDSTLRVVLTPGHAANHCCFILEEDQLLFSGDHILNGSTTIVDPPDGNMTDYLNSLDTLAAADVEFILPAHGYVIGSAKKAIAHLKGHRLKREAKVMAAMTANPSSTLQEWVTAAYSDTDVRLHGIALRSLTAHVERITAMGLAST
jgi:recombination protein RecT